MYAMHGMILVHFEVRRTMHMAEMCALFMPPKSLCEPAASTTTTWAHWWLLGRRRWSQPYAERGTRVDKNIGTCSRKSTRRMCNQTLSTSRLIGPEWRIMSACPSSLSWINEKADELA